MMPDLRSYDWIAVNVSGGKDSQAALGRVLELANAQGVAGRVVAVHCDLGRAEWQGTTELVREQAAFYGVRLIITQAKYGDLLTLADRRRARLDAQGKQDTAAWFGKGNLRYCTSDAKRVPARRVYTALARESRVRRPVRVLEVLGIRAQESANRAEKPVLVAGVVSTRRQTVDSWLPIHEWTEADVWAAIRASGAPYHYAYDLGMPRLSCAFCIYGNRDLWMLAGKHNRATLDAYVLREDLWGHTFQPKASLREVRDALDRGEEPNPSKLKFAGGL